MRVKTALTVLVAAIALVSCPTAPKNDSIPVTGLNLSATEMTLKLRNTATLTVSLSPSNATDTTVSWSSSNFMIASVDNNGKVTANGPGPATITATSVDNTSVSATCAVTVEMEAPKALPLGTAVDVSAYNDLPMYTMLTVEASAKPEGSGSASFSYPGTLATSSVSASRLASGEAGTLGAGAVIASEDHVYSAKQVSCDERMRKAENEALADRSLQFSRAADRATTPISVGSTWTGINVIDFSIYSEPWVTINATCRAISDHAYFFVEDGYESNVSTNLSGYATAFDSIYSVNHDKFGEENDVDGNGKVVVLFSHYITQGVLGYFYSIDKYPKSTYTYSNTSDIFYITADTQYQGDYVLGTLAHEFQHMIYFDQHYNRSVPSTYAWLNEALSQAAEYYNGYTSNHLAWIRSFLTSDWPSLSLTYWTSDNYGYGAVFIRYLIDQYGGAITKNLCSTDKIGIAAVESATGDDFNTIFHNFSRAIVLSGTGVSSSASDNYSTLDLRTIQPNGRGGLQPFALVLDAGTTQNINWAPYCLWFSKWTGNFGTMTLTGSSYAGTAFGLVQ
jgi:hypothetical protein